jgi:bacteriocin resistance YdeI/OmpD-like protein/uncharacterized protein DUF1905
MTSRSSGARFMATIYKIWMLRHVDIPDEIALVLQKKMATAGRASKSATQTKPKYIPVVATVNGHSTRATLVPAGGGHYRMQVNSRLRKAAQADVGEVVSIELRIDLESRELPVPADLRVGLKAHRKARKAFEALGPGHRRHIIMWLDTAKSAKAREQRLQRTIDHLLERALLGSR